MSGRNINIYLQEDLHKQLQPLIKERKVSKFINEAVAEKLDKEKKLKKILVQEMTGLEQQIKKLWKRRKKN